MNRRLAYHMNNILQKNLPCDVCSPSFLSLFACSDSSPSRRIADAGNATNKSFGIPVALTNQIVVAPGNALEVSLEEATRAMLGCARGQALQEGEHAADCSRRMVISMLINFSRGTRNEKWAA